MIRIRRYWIGFPLSKSVKMVSNKYSVGQVLNASSAAVHLGILVAYGIQLNHFNNGVHFLVLCNLLDYHLVDSQHSVLDAFLQEHLLLIGVAGILLRVQKEELIRAFNCDFQ